MTRNKIELENQRGQILVLSVVFLGLLSTLVIGLFQVSYAVRQKIRLQISADAALLSALNCEANALNTLALNNRAVLANDALAAQMNALVSESGFYRKLAERFSRLLRFIPYAGPVGVFLARGTKTMEMLVRRTTSVLLPFTNFSNVSLAAARKGVRQLFPYLAIKLARQTLEMNLPQAELKPLSHAALLRQTRSLQNSLAKLDKENLEKLRIDTMDHHTKKRNWKISVAGISPVKKTGNTRLENGNLTARDQLRMKVFSRLRFRWKTVLSSRSRARDFGYHPPKDLITLKEGPEPPLSLGIMVQLNLQRAGTGPPLPGEKLSAVTAATLLYQRPSRPDETPNTFNPFWTTRLIPVASEPSIRKVISESILREVRH